MRGGARVSRNAVMALALLVALAGCDQGGAVEAQAPSPLATPFPRTADGPAGIEPGTYLVPKSEWSVADFTVTFPEGWTVQYDHVYAKNPDEPDEFGFYAVTVDEIYVDACAGGEVVMEIGPTVLDLAAALLRQRGTDADGPFETTLGGYPATEIDLSEPKGFDPDTCRPKGIGLQVWYSAPADKYFVLVPGYAQVYILNIDGQRQVFLVQVKSAVTQKDRRELQGVLDSIRIET